LGTSIGKHEILVGRIISQTRRRIAGYLTFTEFYTHF
jgi:hypothetical protein